MVTCGKRWIVTMAAYGSDDVGHLTCPGVDESRLDREKGRSSLVWIYNSMQVDRCKNGRNVHVSAL